MTTYCQRFANKTSSFPKCVRFAHSEHQIFIATRIHTIAYEARNIYKIVIIRLIWNWWWIFAACTWTFDLLPAYKLRMKVIFDAWTAAELAEFSMFYFVNGFCVWIVLNKIQTRALVFLSIMSVPSFWYSQIEFSVSFGHGHSNTCM